MHQKTDMVSPCWEFSGFPDKEDTFRCSPEVAAVDGVPRNLKDLGCWGQEPEL